MTSGIKKATILYIPVTFAGILFMMIKLLARSLPILFLFGLLIALAACRDAGLSTLGATAQPATAHISAAVSPQPAPLPTLDPAGVRATVTHVFDGDTIEVDLGGRTYRLRYIGVDTPERDEPFYQEALEFNRDLVEDQTVILVQDVSETDRYGRLLRYVYLEDGTFVNGELMLNGMARLVTFPPDVAQTDYLRELQRQAQEASAGMWSRPDLVGPCDCDRNLYDCRDFQTQAEAQTCYDYCMETTGNDVHRLDGRGDGRACRSLP